MVAKYQDVIDGDVIGTGYYSLVKHLQCRKENTKRSFTPKIRKRKYPIDTDDTDIIPPENRAAIQDTYGCVKWNVQLLPLGESPETQLEKKEKIKMDKETGTNPEMVISLMKMTYYSQCKDINQGKDVKSLHRMWPFLFEVGMNIHFKELTGNGLKESFVPNIDQKGKRLLYYMNTVFKYKCKKFLEDLMKYKVLRGQLSGCSEDTKDMLLLLLLSSFDEREDAMFSYVDQTCLGEEVQMEQVPLTPTIIVCGQSCYSANRFMLSLDCMTVQDNITSFMSAIVMMFGSYYCFNIHYPLQLASTLEFLQRVHKQRETTRLAGPGQANPGEGGGAEVQASVVRPTSQEQQHLKQLGQRVKSKEQTRDEL
ncbi:hypothetical protein WMY93_029858 [Mugilogobius chulae]|uniref:Uncharacterized protein n=1 Tax=Mugilogobius chulae TaxID=88201 RepID=A0AAW0MX22_9GOBI